MNLKRALSLQHGRLSRLVLLQGTRAYQPLLVSFTLTGACNLRCAMCSTRSTSGIFLPPDLVLWTLRGLARRFWWVRPTVHLIGGEPMVHPGFALVVREACRLGFRTTITTNGFFLPTHAHDLVAWGVSHVTVSVDGPEDLHDEIRGVKGSYQAAREGVRRLLASRKKRPSVAINCTISPSNHTRLLETARTLASWGADSLTFQHLTFDEATMELAEAISPDALAHQLRSIRAEPLQTPTNVFPPIREQDLAPYYRDLHYPFGTSCVVPWLVARVYPGAEVAPCLDLYMGNLHTQTLPQVWHSKAWRAFRGTRRRGQLLPGCLRCCHRLYYS